MRSTNLQVLQCIGFGNGRRQTLQRLLGSTDEKDLYGTVVTIALAGHTFTGIRKCPSQSDIISKHQKDRSKL